METSGNATPSPKELFLESLPVIARLMNSIALRHRLSPADADNFASAVYLRLIEDDYALLRKFEHRSSLRTFLSVVIQRIYLEGRRVNIRSGAFDTA